jgi:hypothetical protein
MATNTALEMAVGEDVTLALTMSPIVDISGWTITFTVARDVNTPSPKLITKTASIVSGPAGTFSVAMQAVDTSAIVPGVYQWDAWRTDTGSNRRLGYGTFTLLATARIPT